MIKKLFLNEKFILATILLNSGIIYAQVSGYNNLYINIWKNIGYSMFKVLMILRYWILLKAPSSSDLGNCVLCFSVVRSKIP